MVPTYQVLGLAEMDVGTIREKETEIRKNAAVGSRIRRVFCGVIKIRGVIRELRSIGGAGRGGMNRFGIVVSGERELSRDWGGRRVRETMTERVGVGVKVTSKAEVNHVEEVRGQEVEFLSEGVKESLAPLSMDWVMTLEYVVVRFMGGETRGASVIETGFSSMKTAADR